MNNPARFGVSFSIKQCRNFNIDPKKCLAWLSHEAGFKRFRLMSYWDEAEKHPGQFDFSELDWQIAFVQKAGGEVALCLGAKQPRWPEAHWPNWAWELPKPDRDQALETFMIAVIERYKNNPTITSYQLENEALLKFGEKIEIDRKRLKLEYKLVKELDPVRPIIMTTSSSWGIPFFGPIPDIVGFSYYQIVYRADLQKYTTAFHTPWMDRIRALLIKIIWRKPAFIHELQLEPWGPKNIWEMPPEEQDKSMSVEQIATNLSKAQQTGLYPIDLWGAEWWYWRLKQYNDPTIWQAVKNSTQIK